MERTLIDGRYELGEPLGGGGMARVYLAHDQLLERDVAVKILREQYAEDSQFVERFRREAQNAASLSHPGIVQTYDRGETGDGRYYIAMEHVPGGTLADRIDRDGPLSADTAAEVASQVADALGAAHEQGLVHRDIKPHNVLVTERGDVKVADFGIARAAEETSISRTSSVLGTAAYMSPEQALGREAGPPSDLYSLGVVLYEMLTGEVPFTGASPTAVSLMHVNEEPRAPAELDPEVPEGMNALVMKLLAKDAAARHQSVGELIDDLHRVGEGLSPLDASAAGAAGIVGVAGAAEAGAAGADAAAESGESSGATPEPAGGSRARETRIHRRRPFKRLTAVVALIVALIGTIGWLAWPGDGPGVAGSLDGVPGEPREAAEDAGEALGAATDAVADPVTGTEEVEVPSVEGLTEQAARERLDDAGFESETRPRQSSAQETGLVLEQSVAGGNAAEEGSTILLAVGTGPDTSSQSASAQSAPTETAEVPDVVGTTYPQAKSTLEDAGLTLGGVREVPSQSATAGEIVEQDPGPEASVEQGTPIYLATSNGPPQGGASQGGPPQGGSGEGVSGGGEAGAGSGGYGSDGGAGARGGANTDPYTVPAEDNQEDESYDSEAQDEGSGYEQYEPGD